ncbi:hypothetical protein W97_02870 [Coniosporium apollinis CBS 100218]|uniref:Beta-lactamase-related domain-containing protein n=1 Tax=Coniosporium apollinis (strain CBS 100218) TaxID=1168221 RepID=R7YP30_CONA1|nr:uncharacterized protein W97_02870 [Coniosporium apollinis CBS 100218]EON63642.1 hypothetical protein W97_02870 [Coniosporium apollinis CBS 100218]
MDTDAIKSRLTAIRPVIEEILTAAGTVGLAYGVIHEGKIVHTDNAGFSDLERKLPVNEETIFPIASMTKGLVSSALGLLVEDEKLEWDTPISKMLPDFNPRSKEVRESATLIDLLSMRSGLENYGVWFGSQNSILFPQSDSMTLINDLQQRAALGSEWIYNNWGYEIAGHVIKQISGETWHSLLHSKIFEPLGLHRTDARGRPGDFDNVAQAYMSLDDGTPVLISGVKLGGDVLISPAGGVKSCVKDMLMLYQAIVAEYSHQSTNGQTSTGSPFKELPKIMSAHMDLPVQNPREASYGLGWCRNSLPGSLGAYRSILGDDPVLGDGAPPKLVISHAGGMPGSSSWMGFFPDSRSVIVVLTNSSSLCDAADHTMRLLTQTLFDFPKKNDYVMWAKRVADAERGRYAKIAAELEAPERTPENGPKDLTRYTFAIVIAFREEALAMSFQGRDDETFDLKHHEHDTFSWLLTRDELSRRGRYLNEQARHYLVRFEDDADGKVEKLCWSHDPSGPADAVFMRQED